MLLEERIPKVHAGSRVSHVFCHNSIKNTQYILRNHLEEHAIRRKAEGKVDRIRRSGSDGAVVGDDDVAGGKPGRDIRRRTRAAAFACSRQSSTQTGIIFS